MSVPRLLSLRAVAELTTIPRSTLYTCVAAKTLPVVRIGNSIRVDERDLVRWIETLREVAR